MKKFHHMEQDGSVRSIESPLACSFGITESIALAIGTFLTADVGVGAATAGIIGNIGAGALAGGAVGALTDPKHPLQGAEYGALSGGIGAGAAPLVGTLGLGTTATDAISGALGGASGAALTGRKPLTGALEGGVAGGLSGALSGVGSTPQAPSSAGGSAVATAAPSSVPAAGGAASPVTITPDSATAAISGGGGIGGAPGATSGAISGAVTGGGAGAGGDTGLLGNVGGFLKDNSWLGPVAGIGYQALKGQQPLPGQSQLTASAKNLAAQSGQLQSYFSSGTLPPGVQQSLTQASQSAKASIRSLYASRGMSGSSAEAQDLAAVDERASAQGSQIALQLLQQGVSEAGMADQLYLELMGQALQQDQQLGSAFAGLAASMVPGTAPAGAPAAAPAG